MKKLYFIGTVAVLSVCLAGPSAFGQCGIFENTADWPQIGDAKADGSCDEAGGEYNLRGNGNDIWGGQDEGFYAYTEKEGSWILTAKLEWIDPGADEWAKFGVMIREDPQDPTSRFFAMTLRGNEWGDQVNVQYRTNGGGDAADSGALQFEGENVMAWDGTLTFRLTRVAAINMLLAEWSADDGATWYFGHSMTIDMADSVGYGLAITNHEDNDYLAHGLARNVSIEPFSGAVATRSISPGAFVAGQTLDVGLSVFNPGESETTVTVEESIPVLWSASEVSDGGSVSGESISWDVTLAAGETKELTYKATAPDDPDMTASWSGDAGGLVTAGASTAGLIPQLALDLKVECPYIDREITPNGIMEDGEWADAYEERVEFFSDEAENKMPPGRYLNGNFWENSGDQEYSVTYYAFHNNDYINVALEVVDPIMDFDSNEANAWQNDSTEIYIDGNLSRSNPKEATPTGFQLTVTGDGWWATSNIFDNFGEPLPDGGHANLECTDAEDGVVYWGYGARALYKDGSVYEPGNYDAGTFIVEYRVHKDQILVPRDRTLVGWDFLMNEGDGSAGRTGKYGWFNMHPDGEFLEAWNDETGWGLMELVGGPTSVPDWTLR